MIIFGLAGSFKETICWYDMYQSENCQCHNSTFKKIVLESFLQSTFMSFF